MMRGRTISCGVIVVRFGTVTIRYKTVKLQEITSFRLSQCLYLIGIAIAWSTPKPQHQRLSEDTLKFQRL
jgi:hypothetical protein